MRLVGAAQSGRHTRVLFLDPLTLPPSIGLLISSCRAPPCLAWALEINEASAQSHSFILVSSASCTAWECGPLFHISSWFWILWISVFWTQTRHMTWQRITLMLLGLRLIKLIASIKTIYQIFILLSTVHVLFQLLSQPPHQEVRLRDCECVV